MMRAALTAAVEPEPAGRLVNLAYGSDGLAAAGHTRNRTGFRSRCKPLEVVGRPGAHPSFLVSRAADFRCAGLRQYVPFWNDHEHPGFGHFVQQSQPTDRGALQTVQRKSAASIIISRGERPIYLSPGVSASMALAMSSLCLVISFSLLRSPSRKGHVLYRSL